MNKTEIRTKGKKVAHCLKAMSHEIRLGILFSLREGPKKVGTLVDELGCPQPTLSGHLRLMHDRGILGSRKQATEVFYFVEDKRLFKIFSLIQDVLCK